MRISKPDIRSGFQAVDKLKNSAESALGVFLGFARHRLGRGGRGGFAPLAPLGLSPPMLPFTQHEMFLPHRFRSWHRKPNKTHNSDTETLYVRYRCFFVHIFSYRFYLQTISGAYAPADFWYQRCFYAAKTIIFQSFLSQCQIVRSLV